MFWLVSVLILSSFAHCNEDLLRQFQICKRSDPQLNDCLKSAIQQSINILKNGLPQYNIPSMNPINIPKWTMPKGGILSYEQKYTNIELHDYPTTVILAVTSKIEDDDFSLSLKCTAPILKVKCNYRYDDAKLGGVDVSSVGSLIYTYYDRDFYITFTGGILNNGSGRYLLISDTQINITRIGSFTVKYESENLAAADLLTKLSYENLDTLLTVNKGGYDDMYATGLKNIANAVFAAIPYDKLFPK
ncbi:hypothetical protein RI129_012804 [Pyrocoelia pectoralis]|uniref:Uncharacterized protein n=1 Tax=Pyrocoelia pectoralis TaxID=417401 RepID=A0AAN7V7Y9_9COLE